MHAAQASRAGTLIQVVHGEFTEAVLETLLPVAQQVFLPLLTNGSNQEGWPVVVAKEVSDNLHRFVANGEYCCVQPACDCMSLRAAGQTDRLEDSCLVMPGCRKHCYTPDRTVTLRQTACAKAAAALIG